MNALLGEEIQPVRAIACSGTITVLRYGQQKRVVCRYKNGREEEIPFEQYQVKAAISEEAAIEYRSDELGRSELEEIIFEHPDLELCRNGVEIVDSPGLNEHPDRTKITSKLLKNTDAVIFLSSALQVLTQAERELLNDDLKPQLNGGNQNKPANNLFVVINFIDQLRREKDKQQVQQLVEKFVHSQNPIIHGENRIHFISAQAALDAIMGGIEDDYLKSFQFFCQSLEKFLTNERGLIKLQQSVAEINILIQSCLIELNQAENKLDKKIKDSEAEKQKILEQIGEASGRDVKIRILTNELVDEAIEQVNASWNAWIEGIADRLAEKVEQWSSVHSAIFSREQLAKDYANQFNEDLTSELDTWIETQLKQTILLPKLEILNDQIRKELQAIKSEVFSINRRINTKFPNWVFYGAGKYGFAAAVGILDNLGLAALGATILIPTIVFAGPVLAFIGAFCGTVLLGGGMGGILGLDTAIRTIAFESGWQQFVDSIEEIFEKINEIIGSAFHERVTFADEVIGDVLSIYENILQQQEQANKEILETLEEEKIKITQKRQELHQVQNGVQAILSQSVK